MPRRPRSRVKGSSPRYRAPSHRFKGTVKYREIMGKVVDIIDDPGRTAPLAEVMYEDGKRGLLIAPEGIKTGDTVSFGTLSVGSVMPLAEIPEGVPIYNIESRPGDHGRFVRSSGTFAIIQSKDEKFVNVLLPSKKVKRFHPNCRATIGIVGGSGRTSKPFVKAGNKYKAMRARGRLYPIVSGVSMNPTDHPFGGSTKPGIPKTVKKNAPPGAKVGSFGARRTGRKKRK
ncbi:MAG: 50S ribosomal protein L2 [Candidatus Aenigmatarchaeota archaeon]|nr:MAG: 50S ribosomal protein L2 [Candidatus Aenigmarchaeota archaeon]